MSLHVVDNNAIVEGSAIPLTVAQKATLLALRRVLISALRLIDCLLGN